MTFVGWWVINFSQVVDSNAYDMLKKYIHMLTTKSLYIKKISEEGDKIYLSIFHNGNSPYDTKEINELGGYIKSLSCIDFNNNIVFMSLEYSNINS